MRTTPTPARRLSLFGILALAAAASAEPGAPAKPEAATKASPSRIAVVELFTSEGCSSCPPAELLLSAIKVTDKLQGWGEDRAVFVLAMHVDYWDKLGWTDRFASPAFTKRQREYANRLSLGNLYTPQMVVQGTKEFVGSEAEKADNAIRAALEEPAQAEISLTFENPQITDKAKPTTITLRATISPAKGSTEKPETLAKHTIVFAVTESGIVSKVLRGENAGKSLYHDGVVRDLTSQPIDAAGTATATLTLPPDANRNTSRVIAFVQRAGDQRVIGATSKLVIPADASPASGPVAAAPAAEPMPAASPTAPATPAKPN